MHLNLRVSVSLLTFIILVILPLTGCEGAGSQMTFAILNEASVLDAATGKLCFDFRLINAEGAVVRDVTDFQYKEDDEEISQYEAATGPAHFFDAYATTLLLLDVSGGIVNSMNLDSLRQVAWQFVSSTSTSSTGPQNNQFAVFTFDGSRDIREVITYTNFLPTLDGAIKGINEACMQDCSSNLHGAVMKAIEDLEEEVGKETYGARLVVISDFHHRAGVDGMDYPAWETVAERIKASHLSFFAIGIGPEIDEKTMNAIGRDGAKKLGTSMRDLGQLFAQWHQENQRYRVCYCSPARAGKHDFAIVAKKEGLSATYTHSFDANANFVHCKIP